MTIMISNIVNSIRGLLILLLLLLLVLVLLLLLLVLLLVVLLFSNVLILWAKQHVRKVRPLLALTP